MDCHIMDENSNWIKIVALFIASAQYANLAVIFIL